MSRWLTVSILLVVILASGPLAQQITFANQRLNSTQTAYSRLPVYIAALQMVQAKPLFGWGYGNFDLYDRQFQERIEDLFTPKKDQASHNYYLTIVSEQGLAGLFTFIMPAVWWVYEFFKIRHKLPKSGLLNRTFCLELCLILLNMAIVNSFVNVRIVFGLGIWWITIGLLAALIYPYLETEEQNQPTAQVAIQLPVRR